MTLVTSFPGLRFHWPAIQVAAAAHGLDSRLVAAIVLQESAACADAFRFEQLFWNRYLKLRPEWNTLNPRRVSASYGLMQIMFPVAVERGYPMTRSPEGLFEPEVGLEFGCRQLRHLTDTMASKYPGAGAEPALLAVIASYNGGLQPPNALRPDNARYAASVITRLTALQTEPITLLA